MLDQKRQGAAPEHGGDEQEGKCDEAGGGGVEDPVVADRPDVEQPVGRQQQRAGAKGEQEADAGAVGEPATGEAAHSQAEHEDGDDHRHRFNVDSVEGE